MAKKIFITGAAGFIGFHILRRLLEENHEVYGLDNFNSYYSTSLKNSRLEELNNLAKTLYKEFKFFKGDLEDKSLLEDIFSKHKPDVVINLAAQAGVRYSIKNPRSYISSNIIGFHNILEICRKYQFNIYFTQVVVQYMGVIVKFLFQRKILLIIRLAYMQQPRSAMKSLHIHIVIYMIFLQQPCDSLLFMALGVDLIWLQ